MGWVGLVTWWVGLNWVTQNGPMDNSGPIQNRPPDKTRRSCLCRISRCKLSLETVWRSCLPAMVAIDWQAQRHTRHEKTVLSVSCRVVCIGQLLLTYLDFKFSVGDNLELSGIQFTPPKRTRHEQDSFVLSGEAVWISCNWKGVYPVQFSSAAVHPP